MTAIQRHSSRRHRLDRSFLASHLKGALGYDRIAGFFSSSLLELMGEELDSILGNIRVVCNSDLHPLDVQTAKAAKIGLWKSWTASQPEVLLEGARMPQVQERLGRWIGSRARRR
jgi:hypothetical protein